MFHFSKDSRVRRRCMLGINSDLSLFIKTTIIMVLVLKHSTIALERVVVCWFMFTHRWRIYIINCGKALCQVRVNHGFLHACLVRHHHIQPSTLHDTLTAMVKDDMLSANAEKSCPCMNILNIIFMVCSMIDLLGNVPDLDPLQRSPWHIYIHSYFHFWELPIWIYSKRNIWRFRIIIGSACIANLSITTWCWHVGRVLHPVNFERVRIRLE